MKTHQGVLFLGWIIFCGTAVFLIIEQIDLQSSFLSPEIARLSAPEKLNCKRMNLHLADPQRSVVASLGNGRLGNQMGNFASCYAVMRDYRMYPYLNTMQLKLLENVFVLPELVESDDAPYYMWEEGTFIIYLKNENSSILKYNSYLLILLLLFLIITECIEGISIPWTR
jgi:hypothetical protein